MIKHADSVKIANIAQIVNVLAPIFTRCDQFLLQSIYYPFAMFSSRRDGVAIQPMVSGPAYDSPSYGRVNYIDASAILGDRVLHAFLINRNMSQEAEVAIDHAGGKIESILSAEVVGGSSPKDRNTWENPYNIVSQPLQKGMVRDGKAIFHLPPLSVSAVTCIVSPPTAKPIG